MSLNYMPLKILPEPWANLSPPFPPQVGKQMNQCLPDWAEGYIQRGSLQVAKHGNNLAVLKLMLSTHVSLGRIVDSVFSCVYIYIYSLHLSLCLQANLGLLVEVYS